MKNILICVGTRPNFIKVTQFKRQATELGTDLQFRMLHTGQHFDSKMSEVFFKQLKLDEPDYFLGISGRSQITTIAQIMEAFEKVLTNHKTDMVLVPGDVNSSLACAIVASRLGIPLGHIESGLRSRDRSMPEEINRILIDDLADLLFVSEESGMQNLEREGKIPDKVFHVGNTMIDSLTAFAEEISKADVKHIVGADPYALVTFHRPSNVDYEGTVRSFLLPVLRELCDILTVVFPVHPRTRKRFQDIGVLEELAALSNLVLTEPLGYLEFQNLLSKAKLVVTDSGGIQEETTYLGVPCVTARENTERPSTITHGTNTLAGVSVENIMASVEAIISGNYKQSEVPQYWDGKATSRIIEVISRYLS